MQKNTVNQLPHSLSWRKNAALYLFSQGITLFGSSIVQMAILWQVALETSSGLWITLLTLGAMIPQTVLSFLGGVWADRYPRKQLIILADLGIALVTLVLAMVFLFGSTAGILPLIVIVSALRSLGAGIQTPAVSAVIPQIVPEERFMRYNGINGSMMSIVQFAAPAAAGAILSFGPFHWVLLIDVITAVIGVLMLSLVTIPPISKQEREETAFFTELKAGISYAANNRLVRGPLLTFGAFIFLCVPSGFLVVLMIERTFGSSYAFLTVSEMAGFAGMVLGGLALGVWGGFKMRKRTLLQGLAGYGVFSLAIGVTYTFWLFTAFLFLTCFFIPVVQSSTTTMLQEVVPEGKQGRVFGLMGAMYSGFMPVGMAVFGPLADVLQIQYMVILCGAMILLMGILVFLRERPTIII